MLPYKYTRQLEWNQGRRDQEPILLDHLSYLVLETENRASVEHLRNRKLQRSSRLQIASPQQILSFVFRAKSKTEKRRSEPLSSCVKVGTHSPKVRFIEKKRDIFIDFLTRDEYCTFPSLIKLSLSVCWIGNS